VQYTKHIFTPTHTNSTNFCAGTILRGESSKETIETTAKGTKSEAIVQIENIVQQARREALATQSEGRAGKETEVVEIFSLGVGR
jgi:hypothetical protein